MAAKWYTYAELGEALGIKPMSAKTRAQRNGWPIRKTNHGKPQIEVDLDNLPPPQERHTATPKPRQPATQDDTAMRLLAGQVADLKSQLAVKDGQLEKSQDALSAAHDTISGLQTQLSEQAANAAQEREKLVDALSQASKRRGLFGMFNRGQ